MFFRKFANLHRNTNLFLIFFTIVCGGKGGGGGGGVIFTVLIYKNVGVNSSNNPEGFNI